MKKIYFSLKLFLAISIFATTTLNIARADFSGFPHHPPHHGGGHLGGHHDWYYGGYYGGHYGGHLVRHFGPHFGPHIGHHLGHHLHHHRGAFFGLGYYIYPRSIWLRDHARYHRGWYCGSPSYCYYYPDRDYPAYLGYDRENGEIVEDDLERDPKEEDDLCVYIPEERRWSRSDCD